MYFKDFLRLCYRIQSTKMPFLVWPSCFLISHQWDWAWCTSNQVCYFWLFCSPCRHIYLPVWIKRRLTPNFQKAKHFCDRKYDIAHSLSSWVFDKTVCWNSKFCFFIRNLLPFSDQIVWFCALPSTFMSISALRVCLNKVYFLKIKKLLLKVLYIKIS